MAAVATGWSCCFRTGTKGPGRNIPTPISTASWRLCAADNMQVCQPSTPAQVFHMLRRQIHRNFRKPLVMMMPKALLRYEPSFSSVEQFTEGSVVAGDGRSRRARPARK